MWRRCIGILAALLLLAFPSEAARSRLLEPASGRLQRLRMVALQLPDLDEDEKNTPGPDCSTGGSCPACHALHFCSWLPERSECVPADSVEKGTSTGDCREPSKEVRVIRSADLAQADGEPPVVGEAEAVASLAAEAGSQEALGRLQLDFGSPPAETGPQIVSVTTVQPSLGQDALDDGAVITFVSPAAHDETPVKFFEPVKPAELAAAAQDAAATSQPPKETEAPAPAEDTSAAGAAADAQVARLLELWKVQQARSRAAAGVLQHFLTPEASAGHHDLRERLVDLEGALEHALTGVAEAEVDFLEAWKEFAASLDARETPAELPPALVPGDDADVVDNTADVSVGTRDEAGLVPDDHSQTPGSEDIIGGRPPPSAPAGSAEQAKKDAPGTVEAQQ